MDKKKLIEQAFERGLWSTRFFVLLPVIFSLIGSFILFISASGGIIEVLELTYKAFFGGEHVQMQAFHADMLSGLIEAVDLYLIAIVLLIFSFGLYELFISEIDHASKTGGSGVLEIHSLDQLKDKIAKVIIMVLVVSFFQRVLHMEFKTPLEMVYFASSILILSLGLYFLRKGYH